jgi:hypothetical protein
MRTIILFCALLLAFCSCNNQEQSEQITGDLYFDFFRLASYYNHPDSLVDNFRMYFDTMEYENASSGDKKLIDLYRIVDENGLIEKPYVDILVPMDTVVKLYLEIDDYNRIKLHKRQELL